jgi:hypothetical protein
MVLFRDQRARRGGGVDPRGGEVENGKNIAHGVSILQVMPTKALNTVDASAVLYSLIIPM